MRRDRQTPRKNFREIVQGQGLVFDTNADGTAYWNEEACYRFTVREIDALYEAAKELHQMFIAAAGHVLSRKNGLLELEIPAPLHSVIRRSWEADEWEFYGRFDLTLDGKGVPKLIEYNADTPTGLLEAAVVQWFWKEDCQPRCDQFNSIHESLVTRWNELIEHGQVRKELLHFTSVDGHNEDRITSGYLARTAEEAGLPVEYLPIEQIGWMAQRGEFVDLSDRPIRQLFKLYPWEWMGEEAFAVHLPTAPWMVLEPAWKAIFASKRLLFVLQELYPNHPNLLCVHDQPPKGDFVAKPAFGREGTGVTLHRNGRVVDEREGRTDLGSTVYQEYCPLLSAAPGLYAQCGVWMAGPEPVGMGIREDSRPVLGNTSRFVPHVIE